jgi:photosystem II stability/assembly factor-like uncharacterized protein/uncharacterized protein YqfB (UPF0267 family)
MITSIAVSGNNIFACTNGANGGIYKSVNNGKSWSLLVNSSLSNQNYTALAVNGSNIFAGTSAGGAFISSDEGATWKAINDGLTNLYVTSLAVSGGNIFAGTEGGGIFLSSNNGTKWVAVNAGLNYTSIQSIAISGSNIFAGTWGGGVFLSSNNGANWTAFNDGLEYTVVQSLAVYGNNIYAGTWAGGGVFYRSLTEITGLDHQSINSNSQITIYPNPAKDIIRVENNNNNQEAITIRIFDVAGIQILTNSFKNQNSIELDVSNLVKGIYLLQVQIHNVIENKKLIIQD